MAIEAALAPPARVAPTPAATDRATLTVDLGAIVANWRRLCREAPGAEVAGVVKADAYGLGAGHVAPALYDAGCRCFFVAHLDEGLALRARLADAEIYLLNGLPAGGVADVVEAELVPVLNTPGDIQAYLREAANRARRLPAVLQVDTGMCRLGLSAHEVEALDPRTLLAFDLGFVMNHLVSAEVPGDPLNETQRRRFAWFRSRLPAAPGSLANSSGVFLGHPYQLDLCRPGVALYGVNPTPGRTNPMTPVVTLCAPILQVHEIRADGCVGYGATFRTRPGMRIATVPVGYADGYLRSASNRARARIDGALVPVVGRVSMDLTTLDVSGLPPERARPGTMVELIGGPDGLDELAQAAGTIGYEVLTRLGRRFARRYIHPAST